MRSNQNSFPAELARIYERWWRDQRNNPHMSYRIAWMAGWYAATEHLNKKEVETNGKDTQER